MAYSDILLGISQEARARVMESDRKSARWKYELQAVRNEGVRLLERLKRMMESQTVKSQAAAVNQQKKIDELEAQLQEAEDIVSDLRGELRQVQDELERVIKTKNLNGPVSEIPQMNAYQSSNGCGKCCNNMVCQDLPSAILRGKETEVYRKGCMQRIRPCACDGNYLSLLEGDFRVKEKERGSKENGNKDVFDSFPKKKRSIALAGTKSHLSKDKEINLVQVKDNKDNVKMDIEKVDGQLNLQRGVEKDFKITFQRRRKRQAPSELEADASLHMGKKMKTTGSEKAGDYKQEEIKIESAHESRRLALVARQLMSLSKSKW